MIEKLICGHSIYHNAQNKTQDGLVLIPDTAVPPQSCNGPTSAGHSRSTSPPSTCSRGPSAPLHWTGWTAPTPGTCRRSRSPWTWTCGSTWAASPPSPASSPRPAQVHSLRARRTWVVPPQTFSRSAEERRTWAPGNIMVTGESSNQAVWQCTWSWILADFPLVFPIEKLHMTRISKKKKKVAFKGSVLPIDS